ncbi:hypothetical protein FVA81_01500 (plasmid) [Rhizobium sp. WL3]|uniref:hypothetical protein n=1 Tax=Rhizobium sp. WL3 TaxID=2603277 RepID=UPI0011C1E475|nr:hypothetical protein [Rhizobium sp. WL3]QEE43350.1 hypothetical protein FVA81_01500 [Rhizobium sp. WL3]
MKFVDVAMVELGSALSNLASGQVLDLDRLGEFVGARKGSGGCPGCLCHGDEAKTKDAVTCLHSIDVSAMMMRVGQVMDLADEAIEELGIGSQLSVTFSRR